MSQNGLEPSTVLGMDEMLHLLTIPGMVRDPIPLQIATNVVVSTMVLRWCERISQPSTDRCWFPFKEDTLNKIGRNSESFTW